MEKSLVKIDDSWYQKLIFDLKLLNFEGIVKTKHAIGKRIIEDELKFEKAKYGNRTIQNLADDLGVGKTDLYQCIQFVEKYPEISAIAEDSTWDYVKRKLLPEKPHVSHATGESEWNTPTDIIEAARRTMGSIDCDPATNEMANKIIKAKIIYTIESDGLKQKWSGNIWMNPPYSQPLVTKFAKMISLKYESREINQACVLVNNATETDWFQKMARLSIVACFLFGRVKFTDLDGKPGAPLQGQVILYMGMNVSRFVKNFSNKGVIFYAKRTNKGRGNGASN